MPRMEHLSWQDVAAAKIQAGDCRSCWYRRGARTYAHRSPAKLRVIEHGRHGSVLVQRADGSRMAIVPIQDGRPYAFGNAIARVLLDL